MGLRIQNAVDFPLSRFSQGGSYSLLLLLGKYSFFFFFFFFLFETRDHISPLLPITSTQMKIFNWVHRRFIPRDGLGQNHVKKHEEIPLANSNDDHAEDTAALLLDKVVPDDDDDDEMLQLFQGHNYDGWGGAGAGILSIGTFGLDKTLGINIHPEPNNKEFFGLRGKDDDQEPESEDDDDRQRCDEEEESDHHDDVEDDNDEIDCEEEWNPLVYDKSGAQRPINASALVIGNSSIHNDAKPVRPPPGNLQLQPDTPDHDDEHIHSNYSSYRRIMINTKKEKERITLADLFSADSDDAIWMDGTAKNNIPSCDYLQAQCIKNQAASATPHPPDRAKPKNGTLLFPKKLIPLVKQDSRPIQKLHGLMKRMLKRKIHPDVVAAGKNNACAANESVSLLQSQDKNM
ncbi:uncharacterized protein LOC113760365 [Coffea eugenioides]|uniref:uncharacterized protein LOC113760365 n=1 Tax=Coffea eugenioides TaxID=49369 RepID=UPI000F61435A|nr:uncharacterized protein LOC113760365 [Coffea eugenioides]